MDSRLQAEVNGFHTHITIDEQIDDLKKQLDDMKMTLDEILQYIVKSNNVIEKVGNQVMPTVEALSKHPMLKMLFPKGIGE